MNGNKARTMRGFGGCVVVVSVLSWGSNLARTVGAGDVTGTVRVEEDWELVVDDPDVDTNSPQITCTISPLGDIEHAYAAFDVNFHSEPNYGSGGLQLHVWNPDSPLVVHNLSEEGMLRRNGEVVTWTQTMSLTGNVLSFAIKNGSSHTWGHFGGGELPLSVMTSLDNLDGYNPSVSVENSGVGYAANRVRSLTLKSVRWYSLTGLIQQDTNDKIVHELD